MIQQLFPPFKPNNYPYKNIILICICMYNINNKQHPNIILFLVYYFFRANRKKKKKKNFATPTGWDLTCGTYWMT